jgi:hypothetical protein
VKGKRPWKTRENKEREAIKSSGDRLGVSENGIKGYPKKRIQARGTRPEAREEKQTKE